MMMYIKWIIWALILGVIVSIIIAIVGLTQEGAEWKGMFGGAIISALALHAVVTTLQVCCKSSMSRSRSKE